MLSYMRRNAGSTIIKVILGAVALSFVIFFGLPGTALSPKKDASSGLATDTVALIGEHELKLYEYLNAIDNVRRNYEARGLPMDGEYFESMMFKRAVFQNLVDRTILGLIALDMGIGASDDDLARYMAAQGFLDRNGKFSAARLQNFLRRTGQSLEDYEDQLRYGIAAEKLMDMLGASVIISDDELWEQFQRENETMTIDGVKITPDHAVKSDPEITDEELQAAYDADPEAYAVDEQRSIHFVAFSRPQYMNDVDVTEEMIETYYADNLDSYRHDEQVRFRQIRWDLAGSPSEAERDKARREAQEVLAKLKAGGDFAELASKYSDDKATRDKGGDAGWYARNGAPADIVAKAFDLGDDEISEVIENPQGLWIIKKTGERDEGTSSLDEVRDRVRLDVQREEGDKRLAEDMAAHAAALAPGTNLADYAENNNLEHGTTPLFTRSQGAPGVENGGQIGRQAFEMAEGEISDPIQGFGRNSYLIQVAQVIGEHTPPFDEIKDKVREDLLTKKKAEMTQKLATEMLEKVRSGAMTLAQAAKELGSEVVTSGSFTRASTAVPKVGYGPSLAAEIFSTPPADKYPAKPVAMPGGYLIFSVVSRTPASKDVFEAQKDMLREQNVSEQRNRLVQAFVDTRREKYAVTENQNFWANMARNADAS